MMNDSENPETSALWKGSGSTDNDYQTVLLQIFREFLQEVRQLRKRLDRMENRMDAVETLVAELEADVTSVKSTIEALRVKEVAQDKAIEDLKAIVAELQANAVTPEQKARLAKVDADLDAAVSGSVEPPVETFGAKNKK